MRGELPQFKRCCICLPLRYGLIAWGYIKLILDVIMIISSSFELDYTLYRLRDASDKFRNVYYGDLVLISILLLVLITDCALTTVFVIGGHMKNVRMLRAFYYYSLVVFVLMIVLSAVAIGFCIYGVFIYSSLRRWMWTMMDCTIVIGNIAFQFYILLLLRSEIIKLESNCEFKFVNIAADAECTLTCKDDETNGENGIEAA